MIFTWACISTGADSQAYIFSALFLLLSVAPLHPNRPRAWLDEERLILRGLIFSYSVPIEELASWKERDLWVGGMPVTKEFTVERRSSGFSETINIPHLACGRMHLRSILKDLIDARAASMDDPNPHHPSA